MYSKDEALNCRTVAHMTTLLPPMVASADHQWSVMAEQLEQEAQRLGKVPAANK